MSARLLTSAEAAAYLGTSLRHVRELRYRRELPAVKLGGAVRYDRQDLDAYIDAHREPAAPRGAA